jgi:predicted dehydrogenase
VTTKFNGIAAMNITTDRRSCLHTTSASVLSAVSYSRVLGANERVGIGLIGYGLIGRTHAATFSKIAECQIVAVADSHRKRADQGVTAVGGGATAYQDFRKVLDNKNVQAVIVATPDHWHALMGMMACAAGKDVYVEKPLTLFVREGEWLQKVAERTKRVVQVGTQQRSGLHYQKARELIRRGHLGTVTSVRMDAIRNVSPGFGNPADGEPPAGMDYDSWLGPAPLRKYNPNRGLYHFRWFWDYSGGQMTNLGAHHLDIVDWYLGLDQLRNVTSIGGRFALCDNGETPDTQDAIFDCGKFTAAFVMREAARGEPSGFGLRFHGTKGTLAIDRRGFKVWADPDIPPANIIPGIKEGHPADGPRAVAVTADPKSRTESLEDKTGDSATQYREHATNFLDCIRMRKIPISDLVSAQRTAVACHLANLSLRLGRSLRWDNTQQTVLDDPNAVKMLLRPYRAPWDRELRALGIKVPTG